MSAHTPGPWKLVNGNKAREFNRIAIRPVVPPYRGCLSPIASVSRWHPENGTAEANALLIAAAPELLEACKGLMLQFAAFQAENMRNEIDETQAVIACRDAIAKATGTAP